MLSVHIKKLPIYVMLENIRSVYNVGSIFRSSDGIGVSKIYLTGYTPYPPRKDLHKTALGSEEVVPWEHFANPIEVARKIKSNGTYPPRPYMNISKLKKLVF